MLEKYEVPEMEIIVFDREDIITASEDGKIDGGEVDIFGMGE